MSKRLIYIFTLVFALGLVLAACQGAPTYECTDPIGCVDVAPDEPVHIAYMLTISGGTAFLGEDSRGAIEIAIDDKGQILGHDILLTGEDFALQR